MPESFSLPMLALCTLFLAGCATTQGPASSCDCQRITEENRQLRDALARARQALVTSQAAHQEMDNVLKTTGRQIALLREELMLYRNIIVPPDGKSGLRIHGLEIQPAGMNDLYSYKLTLIQSMKHDTPIQGIVTFQIAGAQNGRDAVVRFPAGKERSNQVRLKYLQEIGGKFALPRGFKPRSVRVSVMTSDGAKKVERTFDWPAI